MVKVFNEITTELNLVAERKSVAIGIKLLAEQNCNLAKIMEKYNTVQYQQHDQKVTELLEITYFTIANQSGTIFCTAVVPSRSRVVTMISVFDPWSLQITFDPNEK